ncbi:MAG: D-alanyl-D-alanine carboxypeptidase, partial [Proteiniphilum sp.]|nr:D-alanyl-D-alanine carboxypeptidase [Proteiniphilum sp.]
MKRGSASSTNLKKSLLVITLLLFVSPAIAQTALQRFVTHPALKHASVGVSVTDLETGRRIVSHNGELSLTPASVLKLITTATAIETFGENYRYKTDVALDAGDPSRILVIGSGDPTLGSEAFDDNPNAFFITVADALRKTLPTDREYTLYVVDNLFGYNGISPEWTWIDMGNYYAAGAYGISIFDNSYKLFFNTTESNGCPQILRTEPEIKGLTFQNILSLNSSGSDNGYIYGAPFSYERAVRGDIPAGRTEFSIKGDIPDPGLLLGETLAGYLSRAGLKIGKVE